MQRSLSQSTPPLHPAPLRQSPMSASSAHAAHLLAHLLLICNQASISSQPPVCVLPDCSLPCSVPDWIPTADLTCFWLSSQLCSPVNTSSFSPWLRVLPVLFLLSVGSASCLHYLTWCLNNPLSDFMVYLSCHLFSFQWRCMRLKWPWICIAFWFSSLLQSLYNTRVWM